jgi:hypothetical protein
MAHRWRTLTQSGWELWNIHWNNLFLQLESTSDFYMTPILAVSQLSHQQF